MLYITRSGCARLSDLSFSSLMSDFPWKLARPYSRAQARISLRLRDFEIIVPSPERPFGVSRPPLNPGIVSILADQSPFVLNPWRVPLPRERGWDLSNPARTRAYVGPLPAVLERPGVILPTAVLPPPPPQFNPALWDWLRHSQRPLQDVQPPPRRHHCAYQRIPLGGMPAVYPSSWSFAEVAHQLFVAQVLSSWFRFQVFGPPHMQVVIAWNAHLRNERLEDLDLSSEIVSQFDDVLSAIARMNADIEGESRRTLTIMVRLRLLSPFHSIYPVS